MDPKDLAIEREKTPDFVRPFLGRGHDQEPLRHYLTLSSTFTTSTLLGYRWLRSRGRTIPRPGLTDVLLLGLAANRISRLITRDKVTRPVRAPFTDVDEDAGDSVKEHPRGHGMTRAIGELVTCPRCAGVWAAGVLTFTYAMAPTFSRFLNSILSAAAISDYVNRRYALVQRAHAH